MTQNISNYCYCKKDMANIEITIQQRLDTFSTERYFVEDVFNRIQNYKQLSRINCFVIKGLRRIGKTTSLYQLYNKLNDCCYIDCSIRKKCSSLVNELYSKDVKVFLIDEICKLSEEEKRSLISFIKINKKVVFVLTGSVPRIVEEIAYSIADVQVIDAKSILYIEWLSWRFNSKLENAMNHSTHDLYIEWLTSCELKVKENTIVFFNDIVQDTLESYSSKKYEKYLATLEISQEKRNSIFMYIILVQLVYAMQVNYNKQLGRYTGKKYIDIPAGIVSNDLNASDALNSIINNLIRIKKIFKNNEIECYCKMLEDAGLLKDVYLFDENCIDVMQDNQFGQGYLFEYPQIFNSLTKIDISQSMLDIWIEYSILNKENDLYENCGKFRHTQGLYEVDSVYFNSFDDKVNIIEVKNQPANNTQIKKYRKIKFSNRKIGSFVISCNDKDCEKTVIPTICRMRNDLIVGLLELAYIKADTNLNIEELYAKYIMRKEV